MKKILLTFAAVTATCMVLICGCTKCKDWPETPVVHNIVTSDCHHFTDPIAAKDMNTDSIVVEWDREGGSMSVSHYNMMLDCGMRRQLVRHRIPARNTVHASHRGGNHVV